DGLLLQQNDVEPGVGQEVGAGAVGGACAYHQADAGLDVVLREQESVGSGASTHATGSLSLLSTDFRTPEALRFGIASYHLTRDLVPVLEDLSGMHVLYQRRPSLRLALDEDEEQMIREAMLWQQDLVPLEWIGPDEVRRLEPRLSPAVRGAVYEDESAQLDSARLTRAYVAAAERRGARLLLREATGLLRDGDRVTGVRHRTGEIGAGAVVLAMGPWAALASPWLGFDVPVRPLKGERLLLQFSGRPLGVLISTPKRGHMISRLDGLLSVGSTAGRDFDVKEQYLVDQTGERGFDVRPTEDALMELLGRAVEVLPAVEEARVAQHLAGVRPLAPDRLPLIGVVPGWTGVYLATGHGTKGIHLAAVTSRIIADLITHRRSDLDVDLAVVDPARFAGRAVAPEAGPHALDD
ncbi:MAG: FAD-dependent oxidoreductase, partial [Chloroflexi bacterium]|nr:FAD-dependent oxidoreductase [Chloroflexota bacterium]